MLQNRPFRCSLGVAVVAMLLGGCDWLASFPKDSEGTLEHVRGGTIRAGVIHAPPWVDDTSGEPSGLEADILRHLARKLDAQIEWVRGGPDELLAMLSQHELQVLAGGFENASPATRHVGVTRPYAKAEWWAVARDAMPADEAENRPVLVSTGTAAALVKKAGGIPVYGDEDSEAVGLYAAAVIREFEDLPERAVQRLGKKAYVLLVPPGEHAWVMAVDKAVLELEARQRPAGASKDPGP